ncbi:16S rRNA (cytosine(1402)-N(4))-methyltransferase, partial [Kitasatospora herbaricolor]|uniref:16S rRNA (cytosine(1402)-N(4))-methyltransferase n=1 Tax=Kitasatospora herbaricolor TaxID=68217 RepID=UPI0036D9D8C2
MGIRIQELDPVIMTDDQIHTPVLLERVIELLEPALREPGAVLVDATLGLGGHS